jgi:hypothetical protein
MQIVINIPLEWLFDMKNKKFCQTDSLYQKILNGTPLPQGHGRLIDIGKIDEDRIDKDNPIIYLTVNGEYIEAVSLDYLNNLSPIIEADKENEND